MLAAFRTSTAATHASFPNGPYECSGLVSAVLYAGGLTRGPMTTDGLKVFGMPGPGKQVTIGVRGRTGRAAHTMIQLGNRFAESGSGTDARWKSGWSGHFPIKRHPGGMARGWIFSNEEFFPTSRNMPPEGWGSRSAARSAASRSWAPTTPAASRPQRGLGHVQAGERMTRQGSAASR